MNNNYCRSLSERRPKSVSSWSGPRLALEKLMINIAWKSLILKTQSSRSFIPQFNSLFKQKVAEYLRLTEYRSKHLSSVTSWQMLPAMCQKCKQNARPHLDYWEIMILSLAYSAIIKIIYWILFVINTDSR